MQALQAKIWWYCPDTPAGQVSGPPLIALFAGLASKALVVLPRYSGQDQLPGLLSGTLFAGSASKDLVGLLRGCGQNSGAGCHTSPHTSPKPSGQNPIPGKSPHLTLSWHVSLHMSGEETHLHGFHARTIGNCHPCWGSPLLSFPTNLTPLQYHAGDLGGSFCLNQGHQKTWTLGRVRVKPGQLWCANITASPRPGDTRCQPWTAAVPPYRCCSNIVS